MTGDLLKYNESDLLFVDIETVTGQRELDPNSKEYELFQWKLRDRDKWDALPTKAETQLAYQQTGALRPIYSKIVCITVGAVYEGEIVLRSYHGEEADILRQFVDMVNSTKGKTLVLWNAKFDMPTLRKRFMINKLTDYLRDDAGNDSMKKPWTLKGILDLMEVWSGISWYTDGLDEVAYAMGLPSPKEDIKGSEVTEAYYNGEIDRIVKYCEKDVATLVNLWRIFTYREVIHKVRVKTDQPAPQQEEVSFAQKVFNRGTVTEEDLKQAIEISRGLKPAQRPTLVNILNALNQSEIPADIAKQILKPPRRKRKSNAKAKKNGVPKNAKKARTSSKEAVSV